MGLGGQRHAPAALPPGTTRYPLCRELSGAEGRSAEVRKISPPLSPRIRSPDRPAYTTELSQPTMMVTIRLRECGFGVRGDFNGDLIQRSVVRNG